MRAVSQSAQNQQAVPAPAPAPVGDSAAEPPQDPQVAAAMAARAKLERLLAAPAPFADDDGSISPHDILAILGEHALQTYLMDEIQQVYRMQGVSINDKHIGIIVRQMLRKVEIVAVGDTRFIFGQQVDKYKFHEENRRVLSEGGQSAIARPMFQGITKASLNIDSFIAAASFQETTRVLTNAAIAGSADNLRGLKENVIIGHLIPAGTGIRNYRNVKLFDENTADLDIQMNEVLERRKLEKAMEAAAEEDALYETEREED